MNTKLFNKRLHNDILKLRSLKSTSEEDYREFFNIVMDKHSLSHQTVYRELAKEVPGKYSTTKRNPAAVKITNRELDELAGLTISRKTDKEMISALSKFKDFKYTPLRLAKAKQKLWEKSDKINRGKFKVIHKIYDPKIIDGLRVSRVTDEKAEGVYTDSGGVKQFPKFSGNASRLFSELAKVSSAEPDRVYKIEFSGGVHFVHGYVIQTCLEHLAQSSLNGGSDLKICSMASLYMLYYKLLNRAERNGCITPIELQQLANINKMLTGKKSRDEEKPPSVNEGSRLRRVSPNEDSAVTKPS